MGTKCISGDLRDDSNPEFAKDFYQALSVVCDDLFFARYRRSSSPAESLSESVGSSVGSAASALLSALYGEAYTEADKHDVMDHLLDTRLLPATDGQGVHFNKDRMQER